MSVELRAWGDESGSNQARDPGVYILGAVVLGTGHVAEARERVRALQRRGQRKVHWVGESAPRRDVLVEAVAQAGFSAVVTVRVGALGERDERRRRKCFEVFAPLLAATGCDDLTLESRGARLDQQDLNMLAAMRSSRRIASAFRLSHRLGAEDPLLWAADILCGAVAAARVGQSRWLDVIEREVPVVNAHVGL